MSEVCRAHITHATAGPFLLFTADLLLRSEMGANEGKGFDAACFIILSTNNDAYF